MVLSEKRGLELVVGAINLNMDISHRKIVEGAINWEVGIHGLGMLREAECDCSRRICNKVYGD